MKTIQYFLILALSVLTCTLFTGCKDNANDWGTDTSGNLNRQWAPTGCNVTPADTYILFKNFNVAGATGYVFQLVPTDDIYTPATEETFATENVLEFVTGTVAAEEEFKCEGLTAETDYYVRYKAQCTGKLDSYWRYWKSISNEMLKYGVTTKKAGEGPGGDDE